MSQTAGGSCGPRHQARSWGQGRDKARTRLGLPGSVLPVARQDPREDLETGFAEASLQQGLLASGC